MIKRVDLKKLNNIVHSNIFDPTLSDSSILNDSEQMFTAFLIYRLRDRKSILMTKSEMAEQTGYCEMSILRYLKKLNHFDYIEFKSTPRGILIQKGTRKRG